jgi:hypothetical protein
MTVAVAALSGQPSVFHVKHALPDSYPAGAMTFAICPQQVEAILLCVGSGRGNLVFHVKHGLRCEIVQRRPKFVVAEDVYRRDVP